MPSIGVSEYARSRALPNQYKSVEQLLQEGNKNLRQIKETLCCANGLSNIIVENYQPLDCNGDPIGSPISVMPIISVAKQDVRICNVTELANAIAIGGDEYDIPTIESAKTSWNLSDSNDLTKVHSISISVTAGTVDLSINIGAAITLPTGYTYNSTASTVFNTEFALTNFTGGAIAIISTMKKA